MVLIAGSVTVLTDYYHRIEIHCEFLVKRGRAILAARTAMLKSISSDHLAHTACLPGPIICDGATATVVYVAEGLANGHSRSLDRQLVLVEHCVGYPPIA